MSMLKLTVVAIVLCLSACIPTRQRGGGALAYSSAGSAVATGRLGIGYSELRSDEHHGLFGIGGTSAFVGMNVGASYAFADKAAAVEFCPLTFGLYGLSDRRPTYHGKVSVVCIGFERGEAPLFAFEIEVGPTLSLKDNSSTTHTMDMGFFLRREQRFEGSRPSGAWLFGVSVYWSGNSDPILDFSEPRGTEQ